MSLLKIGYTQIKGGAVSILSFGAVGDGSTDDSTALQNAINAVSSSQSGTVTIPRGTYYIATSINLASNVTLIGEGVGVTILKGATRVTPNGKTVSSNILLGTSVSNVNIQGITFDGNVAPVYYAGNGAALALVDFETSTNIVIKNCNFTGFIYSLLGTETAGQSSYKLGALFAYDSDYITVENVEYVAPTYGNLLMFIECTHIVVDGARATFSGVSTTSINESPLNIWGDSCQYVTIQNCVFANFYGSAINLGGLGSFIIQNNRLYDAVSPTGSGIDLTNETWVSVSPADMYNVTIANNTFTDVPVSIAVGDVRSAKSISSHEVIISNNMYQMTTGGQMGTILLGNADLSNISDNTLNGAHIQLNYNNVVNVDNNVINGRNETGAGIRLYCRTEAIASYSYIRSNTISYWGNGAIEILGFFGAPYTTVVISDNDFLFPTPPTDGQYITTTRSGGNPAYQPGLLTIMRNRLQGLEYVPFRGTDIKMYADAYNFGTGSSSIGSTTRDMSTATGTQAITGLGFKPKLIIFLANTLTTGQASIGFSQLPRTAASPSSNTNINSRTATSAGTYSLNAGGIFAWQGAGTYYTGSIDSLDADGFTISWVRTGTPTGTLDISYLAFA
jgi:hypothetical protein